MAEAWLGLSAYTIQIYFDFAGYSNMAIGLGLALGFAFPRNFRLPYTARSVTEFWRRWHISLSQWLRDYLYIPLGGSRGSAAETYRNLCLVFLLCGLWHGANWTFVIWGVHHGAFLIIERAGLAARARAASMACAALPAARRDDRLGLVPRARSRSRAVVLRESCGPPWRGRPERRDASRAASGHHRGVADRRSAGDRSGSISGARSGALLARVAQPAYALGDTAAIAVLFALSILSVAAGSYSPFLYFRF